MKKCEEQSDHDLNSLRKCTEAPVNNESRTRIRKIFVKAAQKFPSAACSVILHFIERLFTLKLDPTKELQSLHAVLVYTENPANLESIVSCELPAKYAKLQFFIQCYALRALIPDRSACVSLDALQKLSEVERDLGKVTVIDFVITRQNASLEMVTLAQQVSETLSTKLAKSSRRGRALARLHLDLANKPIEWESLLSHKQVMDNWAKVVAARPEEINAWLDIVRSKVDSANNRSLSKCLINLGPYFKDTTAIVHLYTTAIELEADTPTPHIFTKTQRLLLALALYPDAGFDGVLVGIKSCLAQLKVHPTSTSLSDDHMQSLSGIASALYQIPSWDNLITAVIDRSGSGSSGSGSSSSDSSSNQYTLLIGWFLVMIACAKQLHTADLLIEKLAFPAVMRAELEHAYCSAFGKCYDSARLAAYLPYVTESKDRVLAVLAVSSSTPAEAYEWCSQISGAEHQCIEDAALQCGFFDIAERLKITIRSPQCLPVHEIIDTTQLALRSGDALEAVYALLQAWCTLHKSGSNFDASRYIQAAFRLAKTKLGSFSLVSVAALELWRGFNSYIKIPPPEDQLPEKLSEKSSLGVSNNSALQANIEFMVTQFREPVYASTQELQQLQINEMAAELANTNTVLTCPSLFCAKRADNRNFVHPPLDDIEWTAATDLARKLILLRIASGERLDEIADIAESVRVRPVLASRALYSKSSAGAAAEVAGTFKPLPLPSNIKLPYGVVVLDLSFDENQSLYVTRFENGASPVAIRLPLQHLQTPPDVALQTIESIVAKSLAATTTDAKEFWRIQETMDQQLRATVNELENTWLGAFSGLFSAPSDGLISDPKLIDSVHEACAKYGYPELNSVFVAMLLYSSDLSKDIENILSSQQKQSQAHQQLVAELEAILSSAKEPTFHAEQRIVLICDRKAAQIPWEIFPCLSDQRFTVTRALSFAQLCEWQALSQLGEPSNVSYLVNPGQNLPSTHKDLLQDFQRRQWQGMAGITPSEADLTSMVQSCSDFIYVGHGSGKTYIRGTELRKLFPARASVFLLGCNSLQVESPCFDDDALTDYTVMGSALIMGTLWPVKDKDFNRFCSEFLSRHFDREQSVGKALKRARQACVLPHLTGGAPIVYGLP